MHIAHTGVFKNAHNSLEQAPWPSLFQIVEKGKQLCTIHNGKVTCIVELDKCDFIIQRVVQRGSIMAIIDASYNVHIYTVVTTPSSVGNNNYLAKLLFTFNNGKLRINDLDIWNTSSNNEQHQEQLHQQLLVPSLGPILVVRLIVYYFYSLNVNFILITKL